MWLAAHEVHVAVPVAMQSAIDCARVDSPLAKNSLQTCCVHITALSHCLAMSGSGDYVSCIVEDRDLRPLRGAVAESCGSGVFRVQYVIH
jgi:hypothetical protein